MPGQRESSKRKPQTVASCSPSITKAKRGRSEEDASRLAAKSMATAAFTAKFIRGLAAQLLPEEIHDGGSVDAESALRAALSVLPKGKLKRALEKDEAGSVERLAAELHALESKGAATDAADSSPRPGGAVAQGGDSVHKGGFAAESMPGVVPCTLQLYTRARALAAERSESGDHTLLRSLAVNPRAPVDMLMEAIETRDSTDNHEAPSSRAKLEYVVTGMRNLMRVVVADPLAAATPLLTDRMATFAFSVAEVASTTNTKQSGIDGGIGELNTALAAEALGLMLRILQVASMASPRHQTPGPNHALSTSVDPSDRLLLPCLPRGSIFTFGAPASASTTGDTPPSVGLQSISRILAHYAVALAACSVGRDRGATALLRSVRLAAATTIGGSSGGRSSGDGSGGSSSEDEDDESDEDGGRLDDALSRHLLTLCAGHLSGKESAALDFLRYVGDACFSPREGELRPLSGVAASLVVTCSRVLSRLPRPSASPSLSAALFLKRAYAARVVEALHRASTAGATTNRQEIIANSGWCRGGGVAFVQPWDFVGSSTVPRGLLDFLRRPEAPVAVGGRGEAAGAALRALSLRRDNPASVIEVLRSAKECAPTALGPLLSAVEMLSAGSEAGEGGDVMNIGREESDAAVVGGFFLDTTGAVGGEGNSAVLAPLGDGFSDKASVVFAMGDEEKDDDDGSAGLFQDGGEVLEDEVERR